jgi:hypothetical protein
VVHGGDRLPWVEPRQAGLADNFTPLSSLDWQVHVYGATEAALRTECEARALPLHAFPFDSRVKEAGLHEDTVYLVRPDGHVGGVFARERAATSLAAYLDPRGLSCGSRERAPTPGPRPRT